MKIDLKSVPVLVINLPENEARLDRTWDELINFYSTPLGFNIIDGIRETPSHVGIGKAHRSAIQFAKDNDWEYVCVVEDDVQFTSPRSMKYAQECFNYLPDDFDVALGGIYFDKKMRPYNSHWSHVPYFSGTHYYVVSSKAYDKILGFDCLTESIDHWYAKNLRCYVPKEFFAIQYDGFSDNVGMETDYSKLLTKYHLYK